MGTGASGRRWTSRPDIARTLRRRWDAGTFLAMFARGQPWEPMHIPIVGPSTGDLADRFGEVQSWTRQWREACRDHLRIEYRTVGGRAVGANEIPFRAWVDSYPQLWALLGVESAVQRFAELLEATTARAPRLVEWMIGTPLEVLAFESVWTKLVDTALWIDRRACAQPYLREVDVPGVDTKFIERHRKILAGLLDCQLAEDRVDTARPPSDFEGRYRFRRKPTYVRFRVLDADASPLGGFSELTVRVDELAAAPPRASTVFVVENEVTYLALPPVDDAIVIFGGGYSLSRLDALDWLADRELRYWGDLDTHGFAILNNLRRRSPHARSILMDRATLLAHEDHWVAEPNPVNAPLELLRPDEADLYRDLVENAFGQAVRLEQERVRFSAVERAVRHCGTTGNASGVLGGPTHQD